MICPICKQKIINVWGHLNNKNDELHKKILNEQLEKIISLFYNFNFTKDSNLIQLNIIFPYSRCLKIWQNYYGKEKCKKRANKLNSISVSNKLKNVPKSEAHKKALSKAHIGKIPWNKGLTVDTDERVRKNADARNKAMSKVLKEKYSKKEMVCWLLGKRKKNNPKLIKMYNKVSKTMINKKQYNSRGIAGIRKDIGHFAASTYEANIYRIFQYENKKYKFEFDNIFPIKYDNGEIHNYRIDICDIDGLFGIKGAFIEVKGFMDSKSKEKINKFKEQYPNKILLVLGNGDNRSEHKWVADINYSDLAKKYKDIIPLWEDKKKNIKVTPELYI